MRIKGFLSFACLGVVLAVTGCGVDSTIDCAAVQISGGAQDIEVVCDNKPMTACKATGTDGRYTVTCSGTMSGACFVSGPCMAKPTETGLMPVTWLGKQPVKQNVYPQLSNSGLGCCLGVRADFAAAN